MIAALIVALAAGSSALAPPHDVSSPGQLAVGRPAAWPVATFEVGLLGGVANGKVSDPDRTRTSFSQGLLRFAFHLGATGSGAMRGNLSLVAEGVGMWVKQEPRAQGGGLNLLARYTWAAGRLRPMLAGGAGILYSDEQIPPGETTRNFTPQVGAGLQFLVSRHLGIDLEYRFHHLSNKGTTDSNPGINSHLVLFGVSWFH